MGKHRQRKPRPPAVRHTPPAVALHAVAIECALRSMSALAETAGTRRPAGDHGLRIVFPHPQPLGARVSIAQSSDGAWIGAGRADSDGRWDIAQLAANPALEQSIRLRLDQHDAGGELLGVDVSLSA